MTVKLIQLCLSKETGDRFVLRYAPGEEDDAVYALLGMVADPTTTFDYFDAAVLAHALGEDASLKIRNEMAKEH